MQSALMSMSMLLAPALGTVVLERHGGTVLWMGMGLLGFVSVILLAMLPATSSVESGARGNPLPFDPS